MTEIELETYLGKIGLKTESYKCGLTSITLPEIETIEEI